MNFQDFNLYEESKQLLLKAIFILKTKILLYQSFLV